MKSQLLALKAEFLKNRHSRIVWISFIAFSLAPVMGAVFILMMRDPGAMAKAGALNTKIQLMGFEANWFAYLEILKQAIGVGGILIFGFVASWVFGREYSDGTVKDLLALPTSRTKILNAKFILYVIWCTALAVSNLLIGFVLGAALQIPAAGAGQVYTQLADYFITTFLTILLGSPVAFFAIWGKGYLAPLGFVALVLVFAQVVAATGYGYYFPWSVPGLYSGAGGEFRAQLNNLSYTILLLTSLADYLLTVYYWKYADQTK